MSRTPKACHQCGREIYFDGICVSCLAENQRQEILEYTEQEIEELIKAIKAEIITSKTLKEKLDVFMKLVQYRDMNTREIAKCAFEANLFYPAELYKDAPEDIIGEMIELLKQEDLDVKTASDLLLALAIKGGEDVLQAFVELEQNPRKWRKKLYVNPSFYATYGGWTYDEKGAYIKTQFDKCYPMVKGTPEDKENSPVKFATKTGTYARGVAVPSSTSLNSMAERSGWLFLT